MCFVATYLYVHRLYFHLQLQEVKDAQEEKASECLTTLDEREADVDEKGETTETDDWVMVNRHTSDMDWVDGCLDDIF